MKKTKMLNDIRSTGVWFVGEYAGRILENIEHLKHDKGFKHDFMERIHKESDRDSDIGGTKTRVNALIRIIERNELEDALRYVIESKRVQDNDPQAIKAAEKTLEKNAVDEEYRRSSKFSCFSSQ